MTCMSGPPWMPGKTAELIFWIQSCLQRIAPPRGPRRVLCVVVVTKSACGIGSAMPLRRDQPGDVRHVHHEQGADFPGDLAELREVDLARIGAGPGEDQLRLVLAGQPGDRVVVDAVRVRRDAVGESA